MKKFKIILLVFACVFLVISGGFIFNADIFSGNVLSVENSKKTEEPVIDFDDSVFVEEFWKDKASESYAGGNGTKANPYQISSAAELALLSIKNAQSENNYVKGKYFILTKDIYMNDGYFDDDGTYHDGGDGVLNKWTHEYIFSGFLDGQGFNLYGFYSINNHPLFHTIRDIGEVSNLHMKKSYVKGARGSFAFLNGGIIDNCSFDGVLSNITENANGFGGISGQSSGLIKDCANYGKILGNNKAMQIGGIVGIISKGYIRNCVNYGDVGTETTRFYVGGIAGQGGGIKGCKNFGQVMAVNKCGGIVGNGAASYSENYGTIVANTELGGIIGIIPGESLIQENKNFGFIKGKSRIGGIVGVFNSSKIRILRCENYGIVSGDYEVGGIVGYISKNTIVSECYNSAPIKAGTYNNRSAGIVGQAETGAIVQFCATYGTIGGRDGTAIVGATNKIEIYNCIGIMENTYHNKILKHIYATDLSQFGFNFKTGKIVLNKLNATGVHMGRVDRELLLSKGFEILG